MEAAILINKIAFWATLAAMILGILVSLYSWRHDKENRQKFYLNVVITLIMLLGMLSAANTVLNNGGTLF